MAKISIQGMPQPGQNLGAQFEQGLLYLQGLLLQTIEEGARAALGIRAGADAAASIAAVLASDEDSPSGLDPSELPEAALNALINPKAVINRKDGNGWGSLAAIDKTRQELFGYELGGLFVEKALINILYNLCKGRQDSPQGLNEWRVTNLDAIDTKCQELFHHEMKDLFVEKATIGILHSLWQPSPDFLRSFTAEIASQGDLNSRDEKGYTLLCVAAGEGHTNIAEALIKAGADVDATDHMDRTPLHVAAHAGNPTVIEALIAAGANIHATSWGDTPLHYAARAGNLAAIEALIRAKANFDAIDRCEITPLHWAASTGHPDIALALIKANANIHATDFWKRTPLHAAAHAGHLDIALALIKANANIHATNHWGDTPLYLAKISGRTELVACLEAHKAKAAAQVPAPAQVAALDTAPAQGQEQDQVEVLGSEFSEAPVDQP